MSDEIKYLEQTVLESGSVRSKESKESKCTKHTKPKSSVDTALSTKVEKYQLQQEEAALKVKLAYVEKGPSNRKVNARTKTGITQIEKGI